MEKLLYTFFLIVVIYFTNNLIQKLNILINYRGYKHQKFSGFKYVPLSGGVFFVFFVLTIFSSDNFFLSFFIFLIFCVGLLSDINFLSSPKLRLFLQLSIIIFFVHLLDIEINETRFFLLDILLDNLYFKYFFSVICLLILINGSNFIDGLNGLMIGYFLSILLVIFYLDYFSFIGIEKSLAISLIIFLTYLFILNINSKLFMGDNGAYSLSLLCGFILIKIYNNQDISPYFIVLLLWYPCFENLFSFIRKYSFKKSPLNADSNHFHHLLFFYIKKNFFDISIDINNISSFIIIGYNILIFTISLLDPRNSQLQIMLIMLNIVIYLVVYYKLFVFKYKINFN